MSDTTSQSQSGFWTAFWPGLAATVAGIVIGLPFALWLNSYAASIGQQAQQAQEQQRLQNGLGVIRSAIEFNTARLQAFADTLKSGRVPFDLGLDTSAWDVSKGEIVPYLRNPDLQRRLAYHFSELATLTQVNGLFLEQVVGVSSALGGSKQTREALSEHLIQRSSEAIEESQNLAKELEVVSSANSGD